RRFLRDGARRAHRSDRARRAAGRRRRQPGELDDPGKDGQGDGRRDGSGGRREESRDCDGAYDARWRPQDPDALHAAVHRTQSREPDRHRDGRHRRHAGRARPARSRGRHHRGQGEGGHRCSPDGVSKARHVRVGLRDSSPEPRAPSPESRVPSPESRLYHMRVILLFALAYVPMLIEARRAAANERARLARGGIEAPADVYTVMRVAYPAAFLLMIVEHAVSGGVSRSAAIAGLAVFVAAKTLKWWAILSLGAAWTFRVITVPGAPLVSGGPYRLMRHPNYVAV